MDQYFMPFILNFAMITNYAFQVFVNFIGNDHCFQKIISFKFNCCWQVSFRYFFSSILERYVSVDYSQIDSNKINFDFDVIITNSIKINFSLLFGLNLAVIINYDILVKKKTNGLILNELAYYFG